MTRSRYENLRIEEKRRKNRKFSQIKVITSSATFQFNLAKQFPTLKRWKSFYFYLKTPPLQYLLPFSAASPHTYAELYWNSNSYTVCVCVYVYLVEIIMVIRAHRASIVQWIKHTDCCDLILTISQLTILLPFSYCSF